MKPTTKLRIEEIFTQYHFSKNDAHFITEIMDEIDERQDKRFEQSKELFLTQKDKVELIDKIGDVKSELIGKIGDVKSELISKIGDVKSELTRSLYIVGVVQFFAIVGAVLGIVSFILARK